MRVVDGVQRGLRLRYKIQETTKTATRYEPQRGALAGPALLPRVQVASSVALIGEFLLVVEVACVISRHSRDFLHRHFFVETLYYYDYIMVYAE